MKANVQCDLEMTGILIEHGEARKRPIDAEGHMVPVLCLHVETEGITRGHVLVEYPFAPGQERECEQAAASYRRGARVSFTAPTVGIQLLARNCSHLQLLPEGTTA